MKIFSAKKFLPIIIIATAVSIFSLMILNFQVIDSQACKHETPPEKVEIFIIGDRVADIAHNLGVLSAAMSVRASMWPEAGQFKMVSHMLGCPNKVTVMNKEIIPKACVKNPDPASVPAIKNHRIYSLPFYCDSSVLEYPSFLAQWADALSR